MTSCPPAGDNWEGGFYDQHGRRWAHLPNVGWKLASTGRPFLRPRPLWKRLRA